MKTALSPVFAQRLAYLVDANAHSILTSGLKGIEKESLRIDQKGQIAQTNHPKALGSALTHPYITTDYSEALIELITPPFSDIQQTLHFLTDIHQFVYQNLSNEWLLGCSMPCGIEGDHSVRIAEYGSSNIGKMKHIYRRGLDFRYGRTMQAIAGVHFNYSIPETLWSILYQHSEKNIDLQSFIANHYFAMIRNFQRQGWLILYLFGASPVVCRAFFHSRPELMQQFHSLDQCSLYLPYATSLRMSDIGYKSTQQAQLQINYNHLQGYIHSLTTAMNTPYLPYQSIGVKINGEYKQLNANLLQIENEFYNTIRPKQLTHSGEKPTLALKKRGVAYVEIRSLDLDISSPIGIHESTARFIELFLLGCLLEDSPLQNDNEQQINNLNQLAVANYGRQPDLNLIRNGESMSLKSWANLILEQLQPLAELLDSQSALPYYQQTLQLQQQLVDNSELTPSAQLLSQLTQNPHCLDQFSLQISQHHAASFSQNLSVETQHYFQQLAQKSLQQQQQLESETQEDFDTFLQRYFTQV